MPRSSTLNRRLATATDVVLGAPRPHRGRLSGDGPGSTQTRLGLWWDAHPRTARTVVCLALVWLGAYMAWRLGWSWSGANPVTWTMLMVAELFGWWSLGTLAFFSWRIAPTERPVSSVAHTVDVYVCTYNESTDVLRSTLIGCRALTYPHTTWLLDDGRRPEMAALAAELGARYLTRPDNTHAKAGNINHALRHTAGDLVLVLDADHVPMPDALDALVGYFDDADVALVQTPHDFYNQDSVQHYDVGRHEQSVFFGVISAGKDRHNGAFWCGSASLIRRSALLGVGGVATETIAEDFHTTIKMHRQGWKTRYHREVLVQGLAPHDLAGYLLQRDRWARGNLAVFCTPESPLRARELRPVQRLSYLASLTSYFAGPVRALILASLCVTLWTGTLPMQASPAQFLGLWLPATLLSFVGASAMCRGHMTVAESTHFELSTMGIYGRALRCIVRPGRSGFKVTPKEGVDAGGLDALRRLPLVVVLALALAVGLAVRLVGAVGPDLLPALPGFAVAAVPVLGLVELRRVLRTLYVVGRRRQRRNEFRFSCDVAATVHRPGEPTRSGTVADISTSGLGLRLAGPLPVGRRVRLETALAMADGSVRACAFDVVVRSARPEGDAWRVGTVLEGASPGDRAALVEHCYVVIPFARVRGARPAVAALPAVPPVPALVPVPARPERVRAAAPAAPAAQPAAGDPLRRELAGSAA